MFSKLAALRGLHASIVLALFILLACSAHADLGTNDTVTLAWDYPANECTPDLTFKLYHSEDPSLPLSQWELITVVPGSALQVSITITVGRHYFYLTASNFWGESDPSNVASTPARPRSGILTIRRGN